jgi:hypothetical protein
MEPVDRPKIPENQAIIDALLESLQRQVTQTLKALSSEVRSRAQIVLMGLLMFRNDGTIMPIIRERDKVIFPSPGSFVLRPNASNGLEITPTPPAVSTQHPVGTDPGGQVLFDGEYPGQDTPTGSCPPSVIISGKRYVQGSDCVTYPFPAEAISYLLKNCATIAFKAGDPQIELELIEGTLWVQDHRLNPGIPPSVRVSDTQRDVVVQPSNLTGLDRTLRDQVRIFSNVGSSAVMIDDNKDKIPDQTLDMPDGSDWLICLTSDCDTDAGAEDAEAVGKCEPLIKPTDAGTNAGADASEASRNDDPENVSPSCSSTVNRDNYSEAYLGAVLTVGFLLLMRKKESR